MKSSQGKLNSDKCYPLQVICFYLLVGIVTVPCSLKSCANNALCVFKSGTVECRCPDVSDCPTVSNPVCGSEGAIHKIYSNKCLMEVESCKKGKRISPVPSDKCGELLSLPFFILGERDAPVMENLNQCCGNLVEVIT